MELQETKSAQTEPTGVDAQQQIDIDAKVGGRLAVLMLKNEIMYEFLSQHLEDKHGVDIRDVKNIKVSIQCTI